MSTQTSQRLVPVVEPPSGEPIEPPTRRKPWAAAVLSLVIPGLGQLYAGTPWRALGVWCAAAVATVIVAIVGPAFDATTRFVVVTLYNVGVRALAAWDAARTARRPELAYRRPAYSRWYVYAAIAAVWLVALFGGIAALRGRFVNGYLIPSDTMAPTLLKGDYVFARALGGPIARGALTVNRAPGGLLLIKRVVAIPGDTVAMVDRRLTIDGRPVAEPYVQWIDTADVALPELEWQRAYLAPSADAASYRPTMRSWGPLVVPLDHYFVLGDNRDESLDSRLFGFEPRAGIVGRPTFIYFSVDSANGVRWGRIGRRVE